MLEFPSTKIFLLQYMLLIGQKNSFNSWINKKRYLIKMSEYFPKPSSHEEKILKLKLI